MEELDADGNKLARLVDGRAQQLFEEFANVFHRDAGHCLDSLPERQALDSLELSFAHGVLAAILMHNASSFDRRVLQGAHDFPQLLLGLAKVRPNLPDQRRKTIAQAMLHRAAEGTLDASSVKILKHFQADVRQAASDGKTGVRLYVCCRALRRMCHADVRENERINKHLKLMGQRAPNSRLDLMSARATLKYMLGSVGALQQGLDIKTRRWSEMAPLAEAVADNCLHFWQAGLDVLQNDARWAPCQVPDWLPTPATVESCIKQLDPRPAMKAPDVTAYSVVAAEASRKLFAFYSTGAHESLVAVQQQQFCAIVLVPASKVFQESCCSLELGHPVFFQCEARNRAVRLLAGSFQRDHRGYVCAPSRPWAFLWAAEMVQQVLKAQTQGGTGDLALMAVPLEWQVSQVDGSAGLVGRATVSSPDGAASSSSSAAASNASTASTIVLSGRVKDTRQ